MRAQSAGPAVPAKTRRAAPQSVGRIFSILDAIAGSRTGATLSELAVIAGAPKTSLVGLLAGLTAQGCLLREASGRYSLGPRVHSLAMQAMAGRELVMLARPILHRLVEATGETAVIGALAPDADLAIYLDKVESSNSIRYAVTVGERRDLYCTAMGKALLAHFEPARLKKYLRSSPRERFTATTITSAADLTTEMSRIRREGIARTNGERVADASGMAVPIYGSGGTVVAALLIAGPSARMRANAKGNERSLRSAAAECTRLSGGMPPVQARL
jgi:IclR family transcriptional regulator, acetate operon repressor